MSTNHIHSVLMEMCGRTKITLSALCTRADVNYKTLHGQITNDRAIPFETIDKLANALDLPISIFSENSPRIDISSASGQQILKSRIADAYMQAVRDVQLDLLSDGYGLETDDVLDWLRSENNTLRNFDKFREKIDLFERVSPNDRMLKPVRCGPTSLATRYFEVDDEDHFCRVVGSFKRDHIEKILHSHREAENHSFLVSDIDIDEMINGKRVKQSYRRVIAPVTDPTGNEFSMVFSRMLY